MTLSHSPQFNEPWDEILYKITSHGLTIISSSHNVLSDQIEELKEGLCLVAEKTAGLEKGLLEKIDELEQSQLLTEKEMYQLRQRLEMVLTILDGRGLSLN